MTHFHVDKVQDFAGFLPLNVEKGKYFWLLTRAAINSDMPEFYKYIENISNTFLSLIGVNPSAIYQFLITIHSDLSADIYVNDFAVMMEAMIKCDVKKGESMTKEDIADIKRLKFPAVNILETDKVIYCSKVGWKFGLFFDLNPSHKLDIDKIWLDLGNLYRYLSYQYVYDTLKTEAQFEEMIKDGWFPFLEIIGSEYKALSEAYQSKFNVDGIIEQILTSFNEKRIERIISRWTRKQVFQDKQPILIAGVHAFLRGNTDGWINCYKTLITEIEGIIRLQYLKNMPNGRVKTQDLLTFLTEKGSVKAISNNSLLLPSSFLKYLNDIVFMDFNIETGQLDLSRHSSTHGVAKPADYTKAKALQTILTLDQIYFYI